MKKPALAFAPGAIAVANPVFSAAAAPVPCEDALKDLRAAEASAALSAADKTKCPTSRGQRRRALQRPPPWQRPTDETDPILLESE